MKPDPSTLVVSTTKPAGKIASALAGQGIHIVPITEDEGNVDRYVLSKRLVVERRTGSMFLKGIMEKTLFTSAIYLREHFDLPILVVEGKVNYQYSMMTPQAVRGALTSMVIQYGLNVLSTADAEETTHLIAMLARQEQVGIPEISLIPKRKATTVADMQRRLIEMLPGCGMVLARQLLQRFGTVGSILAATEAELLEMPGIGVKKAEEMRKVLAAEYEAVDTEKQLEDAIEQDPKLLFKQSVRFLDRQHYIFTSGEERQMVDMVFEDRKKREVVLVELKRKKLERAHLQQLRGYLDHARESRTLGPMLADGYALRGILATIEPCEFKMKAKDIEVCIVDEARVIKVLKKMRKGRLARP